MHLASGAALASASAAGWSQLVAGVATLETFFQDARQFFTARFPTEAFCDSTASHSCMTPPVSLSERACGWSAFLMSITAFDRRPVACRRLQRCGRSKASCGARFSGSTGLPSRGDPGDRHLDASRAPPGREDGCDRSRICLRACGLLGSCPVTASCLRYHRVGPPARSGQRPGDSYVGGRVASDCDMIRAFFAAAAAGRGCRGISGHRAASRHGLGNGWRIRR
jgi:hypothetical protein